MINPPAPAKPHTAGILSALVTLGGVVSLAASQITAAQQAGLHVSPWIGLGLTVLGGALQAFTKPVTAGSTDLVAKRRF